MNMKSCVLKSFDDLWGFSEAFLSTDFYQSKWENKDGKIVFTEALPGVRKEDVSIKVVDGILKIKQEGSRFVNASERLFKLPANTKAENISGTIVDGVLTVEIKKAEGQEVDIKLQ